MAVECGSYYCIPSCAYMNTYMYTEDFDMDKVSNRCRESNVFQCYLNVHILLCSWRPSLVEGEEGSDPGDVLNRTEGR